MIDLVNGLSRIWHSHWANAVIHKAVDNTLLRMQEMVRVNDEK